MNTWKKAGLAAAALAAAVAMPAEAAEVSQSAVLSGTVTSVVAVNTPVKEGEVLATVDSLVGPVPAARAACAQTPACHGQGAGAAGSGNRCDGSHRPAAFLRPSRA